MLTTFNALNDATAPMLDAGAGSGQRLPPLLRRPLPPLPRLCGGGEPGAHRPASTAGSTTAASGRAGRRCAGSMGSCPPFWATAAAELSRELIPDPAGNQKLRRHLALLGLGDGDGGVPGRVRPSAGGAEGGGMPDSRTHRRSRPPYRICWAVPTRAEAGEESLTLIQLEPLMAVAGVAARKKDGETVSGDAGTYFKPGGRHPLCAAVRRHGERARGGPGELPGCPPAGAVPDGGGGDGPRPGHTEFCPGPSGRGGGGVHHSGPAPGGPVHRGGGGVQAGAAPTYVRRGSSVRRIAGSSLPAGLAPSEHAVPDHTRLRLEAGDCVLMVSDGIAGTGDDAWVRERLAKFDGESPKELARSLITDSPEGATDDRTALVVRIARRT